MRAFSKIAHNVEEQHLRPLGVIDNDVFCLIHGTAYIQALPVSANHQLFFGSRFLMHCCGCCLEALARNERFA